MEQKIETNIISIVLNNILLLSGSKVIEVALPNSILVFLLKRARVQKHIFGTYILSMVKKKKVFKSYWRPL